MSKAALIASYNAAASQLSGVRQEVAALKSARARLSRVSTNVKYVLESHENIKAQHHLAGTRYLNMTTAEEDILKNVSTQFKSKKDDVISQLDTKIRSLESQSEGIAATVSGLATLISLAKD